MRWVVATAVLMTMTASAAKAEFDRYRIDPEHFSIGFLVQHIGYADTLGMFLEGQGTFEYDEEAPAVRNIEVIVKAASIFTNNERRDNHNRSNDFLAVEDNPEITFTADSATQKTETTGEVTGDLTIRGVTNPVTFELELNKADIYPFAPGGGEPPYVVGVSARATVNRSDFGMTYAVENGLVGDEVELLIEFEAVRQDEGA
ncbi:MAG: YceI family protein [Geminicoccaceae bacterium]